MCDTQRLPFGGVSAPFIHHKLTGKQGVVREIQKGEDQLPDIGPEDIQDEGPGSL